MANIITKFENFVNESKLNEENSLGNSGIVGWYNLFGRTLMAIPTLGTNILIEKGIDYLRGLYSDHLIKNIVDKLSKDELIMKSLDTLNVDKIGDDRELVFNGTRNTTEVGERIKELLTEREIEELYQNLRYIKRNIKK